MQTVRESIKEACEEVGSSLASTLKELGESMKKMRKCKTEVQKLKSVRIELSEVTSPSRLTQLENADGLAIASFVFCLMAMVEKLEELAKEVEELGELASFT